MQDISTRAAQRIVRDATGLPPKSYALILRLRRHHLELHLRRQQPIAVLGEDDTHLGSGLIDQIQKMTMAAMAMADMKVWAQRS